MLTCAGKTYSLLLPRTLDPMEFEHLVVEGEHDHLRFPHSSFFNKKFTNIGSRQNAMNVGPAFRKSSPRT